MTTNDRPAYTGTGEPDVRKRQRERRDELQLEGWYALGADVIQHGDGDVIELFDGEWLATCRACGPTPENDVSRTHAITFLGYHVENTHLNGASS